MQETRHWRLFIIAALVVAASGHPALAQSSLERQSVYTTQANAPVEVTFYTARFNERTRERPEGIQHQAGFKNVSAKKILAVRLGFVSFSVFDEFIDHTKGASLLDIDPGEELSGTWVAQFVRADFAFHTGVVYVDSVRFESGEVWKADRAEITAQLKDVAESFEERLLDGVSE